VPALHLFARLWVVLLAIAPLSRRRYCLSQRHVRLIRDYLSSPIRVDVAAPRPQGQRDQQGHWRL